MEKCQNQSFLAAKISHFSAFSRGHGGPPIVLDLQKGNVRDLRKISYKMVAVYVYSTL